MTACAMLHPKPAMTERLRVLIVASSAKAVRALLEARGHEVRTTSDVRGLERVCLSWRPDLVLVGAPPGDEEWLRRVRDLTVASPDMIVDTLESDSSPSQERAATERVPRTRGGRDRMASILGRALDARRRVLEQERLAEPQQLGELVSRTRRMHSLFAQVQATAVTERAVLLVGETGSGTSAVAQALHDLSGRHGRFVRVGCRGMTTASLERELYGPSPSSRAADRADAFEWAAGGSILLEEIAEMSAALQRRLLRDARKQPDTGPSAGEEMTARIIGSMSRDLESAVSEGSLSEEWIDTAAAAVVCVPALRERRVDIPLLAEHALRRACDAHGRHVVGFHSATMNALVRYDWPGNVPELERVIERAVLAASGRHLALSDLPTPVRMGRSRPTIAREAWPPDWTLDAVERDAIVRALAETGGNKRATAALLGIRRPTLYNKLRKHALWHS